MPCRLLVPVTTYRQSFVQNVQMMADEASWNDEEAMWAMQGGHRERLMNRPEFSMCRSWDDLRRLIQMEFQQEPSLTSISSKIYSINRREKESVKDFNKRFRDIIYPLYGKPVLHPQLLARQEELEHLLPNVGVVTTSLYPHLALRFPKRELDVRLGRSKPNLGSPPPRIIGTEITRLFIF